MCLKISILNLNPPRNKTNFSAQSTQKFIKKVCHFLTLLPGCTSDSDCRDPTTRCDLSEGRCANVVCPELNVPNSRFAQPQNSIAGEVVQVSLIVFFLFHIIPDSDVYTNLISFYIQFLLEFFYSQYETIHIK